MTCLHPNCSMISGGNTLEANARLHKHYINSNSLHVIFKWGSLDIIHYSIFYTFNTLCLNILNVLKVFFSINNKLKTLNSFPHYLNIALNCVSRPPMPILLKSQSGLMICALSTLPLLLPVRFMVLPSILPHSMGVLASRSPQVTWF